MKLPKGWGERLKALRQEDLQRTARGLEKLLAEHGLEASHVTIRRYEKEERVPDLDFLLALADLANVTLDWIVTDRPPKYRQVDGTELYVAGARSVMEAVGRALWQLGLQYEEPTPYLVNLRGQEVPVLVRGYPGFPLLTEGVADRVSQSVNGQVDLFADAVKIDWLEPRPRATESGGIEAEATLYSLDALDESSDAELGEDDQGSQATG